MNTAQFDELVHLVMESKLKPPHFLFHGGYDDWHTRARLAHFLAMPDFNKTDEAVELFKTIVEAEVDEENSEDVEEKVFALQRLSTCLRTQKDQLENALNYINLAIELAESTDFLYKYVLRGELWADRWVTLHMQKKSDVAIDEVNEKIEVYESIPIHHNSYLYFAYRFKAQIAGANGTTLIAKDFMHKALSFMEIEDSFKEGLEVAFSATHDNASWILSDIDKATPSIDQCNWDI